MIKPSSTYLYNIYKKPKKNTIVLTTIVSTSATFSVVHFDIPLIPGAALKRLWIKIRITKISISRRVLRAWERRTIRFVTVEGDRIERVEVSFQGRRPLNTLSAANNTRALCWTLLWWEYFHVLDRAITVMWCWVNSVRINSWQSTASARAAVAAVFSDKSRRKWLLIIIVRLHISFFLVLGHKRYHTRENTPLALTTPYHWLASFVYFIHLAPARSICLLEASRRDLPSFFPFFFLFVSFFVLSKSEISRVTLRAFERIRRRISFILLSRYTCDVEERYD